MTRTVIGSVVSGVALLALVSVPLVGCDKKSESTTTSASTAKKPDGPACPKLDKDGWDRGPETNFGGNGCSEAKLGKYTCTVHGDLDKWKASTEGKACKPLPNSNFWCCEQ